MTFTKKPLTTAGGPKIEGADMRTIILRGKVIDAHRMLRETPIDGSPPALVPASWELIRRTGNGEETTIAKHAVAFDLDSDDNVMYTSGTAVDKIDSDLKSALLFKGKFIEQLIVL